MLDQPQAPTRPNPPHHVLRCDNQCNHGCDQPVPSGRSRVNYALQIGWVVQMYETPGFDQVHDGGHTLAFCDAMCAFEGQRKKLLRQQGPPEALNYARRVIELEETQPALLLAVLYATAPAGQTGGAHPEHDHHDHQH